MKQYKYQIEHSVAMKPAFFRLLQQSDLKDPSILDKIKGEQSHIYMICTRPRISFNPNALEIKKDSISGSFLIDQGEFKEEHFFNVTNPSYLAIENYELKFPNTSIELLNKDGKSVSGGKAAYLYPRLQKKYNSCLDMEVLYVGQAFGDRGERLATDRLLSHSTLQEIYSDIIMKQPNKEVWIILWNFEPYLISMMGSGFENALTDMEGSLDNLNNILGNFISFDQQITFIEAALIRYFVPFYNKEYKTSFPSESHSSYNQCYQLDINSVAFEMNTRELLTTRLFSSSVDPQFNHLKHYPLYSEDVRKDMFNHFINFN